MLYGKEVYFLLQIKCFMGNGIEMIHGYGNLDGNGLEIHNGNG